jgi:hypothetical protein
MNLDTCPVFGTTSTRSHPYAPSLSSSASSSTSSVFSDTASQTSNSTTTSSRSAFGGWDEEWTSRAPQAALGSTVDPTSLSSFAPITRASTFPLCQPSACRESTGKRDLPPLQTDLTSTAEQRPHPRRSSTAINHRQPPPLVRQGDRKVNFVDCLVG